MVYVKPRAWWKIALIYVIGGVAIGTAVPWLKSVAANQFGRSGFAVAFVINIAMPLLVIGLALWYPKFSAALLGTLAATLAFLLSAGLPVSTSLQNWLINFIQPMGPILFVACLAYHALSVMTVLLVNQWRRVGLPPDPWACRNCGYSLKGLAESRCPECGQSFGPLPIPE